MNEVDFYLVDLKSRFDKIKLNTYYLSYSGGKDSHFLYWFIKEYLKRDDIKIVGINTYMEHHEIRDRILKNSDIVLYPKMKPFEIKVWEYLTKNNLKSRLVLPIHDELMVSVAKDEMFVIEEVKKIMEDVTDVIKSIPMISEPEMSETNWACKKEYMIEGGK